MSSQKTNDISSPRKRSPRKQFKWGTRRTAKGNGKQASVSQQKKCGEQKTLQHFFFKQKQKSEATDALKSSGSRSEPLIIHESSDEDNNSHSVSKKLKVARNLFTPSPEKISRQESGFEEPEDQKPFLFDSVELSGPSLPPQGVVISPIKEPNIDFHREDTDEIMGSLPDISPEKKRQWTPEADTFDKLLEKSLAYNLICEDDLELLDRFRKLSRTTQDICLRLYQRKHKWILRSKITYKVENIEASLAEAVAAGFLDDKTKMNDLDQLLDLLPMKETLTLGRKFCDLKSSTKTAAVNALRAHSERKDVLFGSQRIRQSILKSGQDLLEQCYFVVQRFADAATRVLTLFSLGSHFDTFSAPADRTDHGCCHLFVIGQYLRGAFTYPEHETRAVFEHIFKTPQDFTLYSDARLRHFQVFKAMETHRLDEAMQSFEAHFYWFISKYSSDRFLEDASLPQFLHRFTFSYCFLKFLATGAEICEKQKKYDEAVDLYFTILSQTQFMQNRRGRFWNRLLLDVDAHLKKPHNSLALAHIALRDSIYNQQKYDIYNRAKRLSERFKVKTSLPEFVIAVEAPVENISGQLMKREIIGRRNVFASVDASGERAVGPEAVAIEHYLDKGFSRGVHGETPTMLMLFALLSWDIIFCEPSEPMPEVPRPNFVVLNEFRELEAIREIFTIDIEAEKPESPSKPATKKRKRGPTKKKKDDFQTVAPLEHTSNFHKPVWFPQDRLEPKSEQIRKAVYVSEYQSGPLDLGYPEFYLNRKRAVDDFLTVLSQMSNEEIISTASENYDRHNGKVNPLFNWEVLTKEEVLTLLACIPLEVLVGIFRQLLTDFRFYRSGFPDIIMWNEETRIWKVIEVKGPGDTLSTKQRYWMHLLISLGVDCVTCRVASVHNKKIRPNTDS